MIQLDCVLLSFVINELFAAQLLLVFRDKSSFLLGKGSLGLDKNGKKSDIVHLKLNLLLPW